MALLHPLRRCLLHGPKINLARLFANDASAQEGEFRQRLRNLPPSDRFGSISKRPAVVPQPAESEPDIEGELDAHRPLAVYGRRHERLWYKVKMRKLLDEGRHEEAADVLYTRMLVQDRVKPTRDLYNRVMCIHRDHGQVREAKKLLDMMKNYRCPPNNLTYGLFFDACGCADDLQLGGELAAKVYRQLPLKELPHSIYSAAIACFAKTKNLALAMRALDDLLLSGRYRPSAHDLSAALDACRNDSAKGALLALQVWRRFRQIGRLQLRGHHYTRLLQCLLGCGVGDVDRAADALMSDGARFDYTALMTGGRPPQTEESAAVQVRGARQQHGGAFDDKLLLSSPVNLLCLGHALPGRESLRALLRAGQLDQHRQLCLAGGLQGLVKSMAADGVQLNKFHVSQLCKWLPAGDPALDGALRLLVGPGGGDTALQNAFLRRAPSALRERTGPPDLVTFGILSRHANSVPRVRAFAAKLAAAGQSANHVMCANMFLAAGLDFNAKSCVLDVMVEHDVSPTAKMIETIERNVHAVRQHVISAELKGEAPGFVVPFHVFCIKYAQWLRRVALHPDDVPHLKKKT